jgi:tripartite-type tricarboxylate transporter receptor subunit TctC
MRQWPSLKSDPLHCKAKRLKESNNSFDGYEASAFLSDPEPKRRLAEGGVTVLVGSPADFGKFVADETEKWAKVIKFANIKPE